MLRTCSLSPRVMTVEELALHPLARPLHERCKKKTWKRKNEHHTHRQMAAFAAQGFTYPEIASLTGYTRESVRQNLMQPETQEMLTQTAALNAQSEIKKVIEDVAKGSVLRLADIAQDENIKQQNLKIYTEVNQSFIDRYLGRAPVVVEGAITDPNKLTDKELANRIAQLEQEVGVAPRV